MNLRFFGPHGLYALIMAYRPNDNKYDVGDTINDAVANRVDEGSRFSRKSGTTKSELELPEACPLIFPDLDKIPDDKKPNVVKRAGAVASDYYDRRAQAQFVSIEKMPYLLANVARIGITPTQNFLSKTHNSRLDMVIRIRRRQVVDLLVSCLVERWLALDTISNKGDEGRNSKMVNR